MRQWCADRYTHHPVTPEDMNSYYERYIDGHKSLALTMQDGDEIVGYITLRTPSDDPTEQRLGFVIVVYRKLGFETIAEREHDCLMVKPLQLHHNVTNNSTEQSL